MTHAANLPPPALLLVGCGNMGGALWDGWRSDAIAPSVVLDRHRAFVPAPHHLARTPQDIPPDFRPDFVVLAVKPAKAEDAIASISSCLDGTTLLSVMAGRSCASLREAAARHGATVSVVRAMPNTPASIGQGVTGIFADHDVSPTRREQAVSLLRAVGGVAPVTRERQLDLVTAISGSGPAYVFLLAELLEKAGIDRGLPPETARLLARGTVSGAGALLAASSAESRVLRENVTSPNGTTARALSCLMAPNAWPASIDEAITAAAERAAELAR